MEGFQQQQAARLECLYQLGMHGRAQCRGQVQVDHHHRIGAGWFGLPAGQIGLYRVDCNAPALREVTRTGQAHCGTVDGLHEVALFGQPDAIAAFAISGNQNA